MAESHNTRGFPHLDLSFLAEREELIIHMRYCAGWSLRKVSTAIGVDHMVVQRQHTRALQAIREHGGEIISGNDDS